MVEFYLDGESHLRSETLELSWAKSLVIKFGRAACGQCRRAVTEADERIRCPSPTCDIAWEQVIYSETTDSFRHRSLPMIGRSAVYSGRHSVPRDEHLPNLRGRSVQTARLTGKEL